MRGIKLRDFDSLIPDWFKTFVQVGNDLQKVMCGQSPVYNYVYFPVSGHIYNVQKPSAVYIKSLGINYRGLYWGTLNHR